MSTVERFYDQPIVHPPCGGGCRESASSKPSHPPVSGFVLTNPELKDEPLPDVLSRPDLDMVALDYFRRLGHDNHRRLSKLYGWEDAHGECARKKKSKTSWGAQTVDYEKIAAAAVQAMKAADLNRFLVVCALVSDLYCPGSDPRQPLEKNSNLARTAARYKMDSAKMGTAVRAELSNPKKKPTKQSQPASNLSTAKSPHHKGSK